ncbi:dihydroxy-acid dehydratase [Deltaproteobacteria bacterium OttesenSCG-928-M10]|nr:dihydroxy-acid dehydratase [Deltaproteobacteria bacterium OttesenSCG-928-M10]
MKSQEIRKIGPEIDPISLGTGKSVDALSQPQILLESTYGDTHPGSRHLYGVAESAKNGCLRSGLSPSMYFVTDICDGVATGHDGMNYSLPSRDIISAMVEIHAMAFPFDAMITFSSCDKALPAHLMTHLRLDLPGIHVSGGSMDMGPNFISAELFYDTNDLVKSGQMTAEEEMQYKLAACPSCGACQYMGTASTMQVMAEALGLSLPTNALIAPGAPLEHLAGEAGRRIKHLIDNDIRPSRIMTDKAFENAMILHAAVAGSTNILLHLPAVAAQGGIRVTLKDFDHVHRNIPVLCSLKTSGQWPTRLLWYAGGVPALMRELKNDLNLDVLTVTGKTLGENLYDLEQGGFFERQAGYLANFNLKTSDVIRPKSQPVQASGGISVLYGNIATDGAVVKHSAVPENLFTHTGPAKPFDSEEDALAAIDGDKIAPGDVIVIRYEGATAAGMPEMLKTTEKIFNRRELSESCVLITDGRFSGATRGPAVGHVSPEAINGGAIALIEEDDLISLDIKARTLNLVGVGRQARPAEEISGILAERRKNLKPRPRRGKSGILRLFADNANDAMYGGSIFK